MAKDVKVKPKVETIYDEAGAPIAVLTRSQSSCEVTRDAKGSTKFTVKAYADTMDDAVSEAIRSFNKLSKEFDE